MSGKKPDFWENTSINAIINIVRTVIFALVGIFMVPFYVDNLGLAAYGVIPLATTMSSYIMVIADPLASVCSRYSVLAIQQNDQKEIVRNFNTAFFGIGRILLLLAPIMILFAICSPYLFSVDSSIAADVQIMFALIMISSLINTSATAFDSIMTAYNKLYISYLIKILYIAIQVSAILCMFFLNKPSLIEVGIAYMASSLILLSLMAASAFRLCPCIKIRYDEYDPVLFRDIGSVGAWNVVTRVGTMLFLQASLVMTNIFIGGEAGGGYAMVISMISMVDTASMSVLSVISPLVLRHYAEGNIDHMKYMLKTSIKVFALIFAMPIAFVIVFSGDIFSIWVGPEYTYLSKLVTIAFLAEMAYILKEVVYHVPIAFKKTKEYAKIAICFGIMNIILTLVMLFVVNYSETSIILSWSISMILFSSVTFIFNSKLMNGKWYELLIQVVKGYILMGICYLILSAISDYLPTMDSWFSLIAVFLCLFVVFAVVIYMLFVKKDERALMANAIPGSVKKYIPAVLLGKN